MKKPDKVTPRKKVAYYGEKEHIFLFNTIVIALNVIYDAAEEGSPDAEKVFHDLAELFVQKAGDLS